MTHNLIDLFWAAGSICSGLVLLYGAYLVFDLYLNASGGFWRAVARLSLYDSLGCRTMASNAREELLQESTMFVRPGPWQSDR